MTQHLLCCSGSLEGGGSERQLWQLVNGLDRSTFCPSVYLLYRKGKYLQRLAEDIDVFDFWSHYDPDRFLIGQTHREQVKHLQATIEQQNVDVVYDRTFHMTLVTAPACRRAGVPRVSAIVSPPSQDFARSPERFRFLKKWLLQRAYRDPRSLVVTVSDAVADDAATYYQLERERIRVVPSPVDTAMVREKSAEPVDFPWAGQAGSNALPGVKQWNVCVVGRLSAEKGQRDAILAFAEFVKSSTVTPGGSAMLHLVGDGPMRGELESLVGDLGLATDVQFHGFVENPYPIMRCCDLLLLPSHYEGLPNVVLEAMALEKSLLVTRCSKTLEGLLVRAGLGPQEARIVPVGDVAALAAGIGDCYRHFSAAGRVSAPASRAYVETHHGMSGWLKEMQGIFAELRKQSPAPPRRFA